MIIDGKEHVITIDGRTFHCSVDIAIGYVGGKWKTVVLYYLMEGTKRYSELKRLMPDITEKMLARQLQELRKDGFIHRHDYRSTPPRVEYSLTDEGRSLIPLLEALSDWGKHKAQMAGKIHESAPAHQ